MAQRQIPPERKTIYYVGMTVCVIGFICFISVFFSFALNFGDFNDFTARSRSMNMRALIGMMMILLGTMMMKVGRMGLAGSGAKLEPEQARRDVEPWSRMTGGVVKDALDEAGIKLGANPSGESMTLDERLRRLQKLRDDGLVNENEYESTKKKILESA